MTDDVDPFAVVPRVTKPARPPIRSRPVSIQPPMDEDDPFAVAEVAQTGASLEHDDDPFRLVTDAVASSWPEPSLRRHELGDPFSAPLTLPCIIVERRDFERSLVVQELGVNECLPLRTYSINQTANAEAAALLLSHSRGAMLINGVHPPAVVIALEAGVAAAAKAVGAIQLKH